MTTKTNETAKTIFESNEGGMNVRTKNTMAAAAGALAGLGITSLSDRSNAISLGATAAFGALSVAAVYNNNILHALTPDSAETKGIIGGVIGVETALFGCVMNLVAGDKPEAE